MSDKKIPEIYNYCDRWCERCAFSTRCAIYESEADVTTQKNDFENKAFLNRLVLNVTKAQQMLEQAALERGIDLHKVTTKMTEYEEKKKQIEKETRSHPLARLSLEYSSLVNRWIDSQPGMEEKLESFQQQLELSPESFEAVKSTTDTIQDCHAVIKWYDSLIYTKFMRAFMGKAFNDFEDEEQRDCDGSAKVALIGVERSMQAWIKLYELLPDQEDEFLKILAMLQKLKTLAIEAFPKAMAFKRPGFDD